MKKKTPFYWDLDPDRKVKVKIGGNETMEFRLGEILVAPGQEISLEEDYNPGFTGGLEDKSEAKEHVEKNVRRLAELQEKLYAQDTYALLILIQAMDAAGKDGVIRHVMSGVNPQGCHVTSFKSPSAEELDHDYLWRASKALPERGMIGIFNRSYYEEVLVVRVHPEFLEKEKIPPVMVDDKLWKRRFEEINEYETYLHRNGILVLKFFLNLSKKEQKKRFISRIDEPEKNWKFSTADVKERGHWQEYQEAFEDMLNHTSTREAPWFVIPADNKWFSRLAVSEVICQVLEQLDLGFPVVSAARKKELEQIRKALEKD